jgi:hypothetical protein
MLVAGSPNSSPGPTLSINLQHHGVPGKEVENYSVKRNTFRAVMRCQQDSFAACVRILPLRVHILETGGNN